jgi:NodT family efflux transporter outer membrane factor (OMF) lipoprotein
VAADLENTRLLLAADVASNYLNLRAIDTELDVLGRAVALQRKALALVAARRELGATSGLELAQQQALLDNTLTQLEALRRQRGPFEHALATLVGTPAPLFALAPELRPLTMPEVPLGLPSDLLERRPDVASAERAMAVANAQIGLANAAFYPSITLSSNVGQQSRALSRLLDAPSLIWSVGANAAQVLFDGGRLRANQAAAQAGHQVAAANYRRVVLAAMQEVQDGISGLAALQRAGSQAHVAVASAQKVLALATGRYEGGVANYLEVITAQQALLAAERQAAQLQSQAGVVSVFLIKALGGDW